MASHSAASASGDQETSVSKTLHLRNITKAYGGRTVADIRDLVLGSHGIEGLIGPNGAGKTTLMKLITHEVQRDSGHVVYYTNNSELEISESRVEEIARLGIVKTNQVIQDFESLTIKDSLLLALASSPQEKFYNFLSEKKLRAQTEEEIDGYLDYFHFEDPDGRALSAGEKKLLDIVRCLVLKPKFLLMDEPTAGLPEDQTRKVMDLMARKTAEEDMSILIVEHDLDLIWEVCEFVHFMAEGQILVQGPPEEIRSNSTLAEKYLGTSHV